jgi:hypothetical protein
MRPRTGGAEMFVGDVWQEKYETWQTWLVVRQDFSGTYGIVLSGHSVGQEVLMSYDRFSAHTWKLLNDGSFVKSA